MPKNCLNKFLGSRSHLRSDRVTESMKATGNKVLVQQDEPETMKGSIHLPDGQEEFPNRGVVLSVGSKVKENIQVGDRVIFERKPESALAGGWGRPGDRFYGVLALPEDAIIAVMEGN